MRVVELKGQSQSITSTGLADAVLLRRSFRVWDGVTASQIYNNPTSIIDSVTGFSLPGYTSLFPLGGTTVFDEQPELFTYQVTPVAGGEAYDAVAVYTSDRGVLGRPFAVGVAFAYQSVEVPYAELREIGYNAPSDQRSYAYAERTIAMTEAVVQYTYQITIPEPSVPFLSRLVAEEVGNLHNFEDQNDCAGEWYRFDGGESVRIDNRRFRTTFRWTHEKGTPVLDAGVLPEFTAQVTSPTAIQITDTDGSERAYDPATDKIVTPDLPWTDLGVVDGGNSCSPPDARYSRPPFSQVTVNAAFSDIDAPAKPMFKAFSSHKRNPAGWRNLVFYVPSIPGGP